MKYNLFETYDFFLQKVTRLSLYVDKFTTGSWNLFNILCRWTSIFV